MPKYVFVVEIEADSEETAHTVFDTMAFNVPLGVRVDGGYFGEGPAL